MNPSQVARIAHEIDRARGGKHSRSVSWEQDSPEYRQSATNSAALLLVGAFDVAIVFDGDPVLQALFRACMPPVVDGNEAPEVEPDRKPGYSDSYLRRADPGKRERMKPSECVTLQGQ